jgi:hypothetical protein
LPDFVEYFVDVAGRFLHTHDGCSFPIEETPAAAGVWAVIAGCDGAVRQEIYSLVSEHPIVI